jgi:opacity protein-like surface antigen
MFVRKYLFTATMIAVAFGAAPRSASADWVLTPFVGVNFGSSADVNGSGGSSLSNKFEKKIDYGASLAGMGAGALGFELDFGYSPNFFETNTGASGFQFTSTSNVTTLMGNLIVGAPIGGHGGRGGRGGRGGHGGGSVRPYGLVGVGLLRTKLQDIGETFEVNTKNDFGLDVGGGVMGFFSENVGLRGDLRYFRGFRGSSDTATGLELGDFKFWRGSIGLSLKF